MNRDLLVDRAARAAHQTNRDAGVDLRERDADDRPGVAEVEYCPWADLPLSVRIAYDTHDELDALPGGTIVVDAAGRPWTVGVHDQQLQPALADGPLTVVWQPEAIS